MNPHLLESLYTRLGQPAWFWPVCMAVLFVALPLAVGAIEGCALDDNSGDYLRAAQMERQLARIEAQARLEEAARAACGPNAAFKIIGPTRAQCFDKHGRPTGQVELRP